MTEKIPKHKWTHDSDRVLIVKCCDSKGRGFNGFQYPERGTVKPEYCSREPTCESGGLFGWAWGINLGIDRDLDYSGVWLVLSAPADQVIEIGGKCKIAADSPCDVDCEVVYYGSWAGAQEKTRCGRIAWIIQNSSGSASASGDSGSASASGERGSASASGYRGSASASGSSGSASASGDSGSASASGYSGSASASGYRGICATSSDYSTIEISGKGAIGCTTATKWIWKVHAGAVVANRWVKEKQEYHKMFVAHELGLNNGQVVKIEFGEIVDEFS